MVTETGSWDPDDWEDHCRLMLRLRYGVDFVPVPDKTGGDGGLDGFVRRELVAWQFYAPEDEPLTPSKRCERQQRKITRDIQKLNEYRTRVQGILGGVRLQDWILLTPRHESADLIGHCNAKAELARSWNLPFLAVDFNISVQDLKDFQLEHAKAQECGLLPSSLMAPMELPELTREGVIFSQAAGPRVDVMDGKLKRVQSDHERRAFLRGEYLKSKYATEDLLDRYDTHVPDVAHNIRYHIGQAKRAMLMSQAQGINANTHLSNVQADIRARVRDAAPGMSHTQASHIAEGTVCEWLEECSLSFAENATSV